MQNQSKKLTTKDMTYIAMFAVILAVCAWITIPTTVPFTLQIFGAFAALGVLVGLGLRVEAIVATLVVFLVLWVRRQQKSRQKSKENTETNV